MNDPAITRWLREHSNDENADATAAQVHFLRNKLPMALSASQAEYNAIQASMQVLGSHRSQSVSLPVVKIVPAVGNWSAIVRGNFRDWKVSFEWREKFPFTLDTGRLFDLHAKYSSVYCEGFPVANVYGSYVENPHKFTAELYDDVSLYTFFFMVDRHVRSGGALR